MRFWVGLRIGLVLLDNFVVKRQEARGKAVRFGENALQEPGQIRSGTDELFLGGIVCFPKPLLCLLLTGLLGGRTASPKPPERYL